MCNCDQESHQYVSKGDLNGEEGDKESRYDWLKFRRAAIKRANGDIGARASGLRVGEQDMCLCNPYQ